MSKSSVPSGRRQLFFLSFAISIALPFSWLVFVKLVMRHGDGGELFDMLGYLVPHAFLWFVSVCVMFVAQLSSEKRGGAVGAVLASSVSALVFLSVMIYAVWPSS